MIQVVIIGDGREATLRAQALADVPDCEVRVVAADSPEVMSDWDSSKRRIVFASNGPPHFSTLADLARQGAHLFLEWPPASSVKECQSLAGLGEEAGIEIGVSRPLRYALPQDAMERFSRVDVLTFHARVDAQNRSAWKRVVDDAIDLANFFARGASARRVDAAAARSDSRLPLVVAAGIRFQNGSLAQLEIRHRPDAAPTVRVHVAGPGYAEEVDLTNARDEGLRSESKAFVEAISANRTPPVSVLDALQTIRLHEKLMERLRRWQ